MKIEIYNEQDRIEEPVLRLKLEEAIDGAVQLVACDKSGSRLYGGTILLISNDGTLTLSSYIAAGSVSIQKDVYGYILIK